MCSMYWNLTADVKPPCGHESPAANLQTHFMGEAGSCVNNYKLGQLVGELEGYFGGLPKEDWLIGKCNVCGKYFEVDALVENGAVVALLEPVVAW